MQNIYNRQQVLTALVPITIATIAAGGFSVDVPHGAYVLDVAGTVNTAFDTDGSTPTVQLTVGDGTTTFVNAQSVAATGAITAAVKTRFYPTGGTITGTVDEAVASGDVTTATEGEAYLAIRYVQAGRGNEIQG